MNLGYLILIVIFMTSCREKTNKSNDLLNSDDSLSVKGKCFTATDTLLNTNNWVKYISIGEGYAVEIKVNGVIDTLSLRFDCTTPEVLVPCFLWKKDNTIFLTRGSGQHFREMFACTQIANSVNVVTFESERGLDAQYDFAYKLLGDRYVHLYDELSRKKRALLLPTPYQSDTMQHTLITKDSIVVMFKHSGRLSMALHPPKMARANY